MNLKELEQTQEMQEFINKVKPFLDSELLFGKSFMVYYVKKRYEDYLMIMDKPTQSEQEMAEWLYQFLVAQSELAFRYAIEREKLSQRIHAEEQKKHPEDNIEVLGVPVETLYLHLIDLAILNENEANLTKYFKRVKIPNAATFSKEIQTIYREVLERMTR
ncbi:hypothetical protein [Listeria costaricensis]|uniref:hypothetical protein n=1 Tax=Listeria costaricensis TaxID=2026604 RepID=UPI000C072CF6|nr:hypothetical protein [Listeria costaricensis]